jgi:hypothetical protein
MAQVKAQTEVERDVAKGFSLTYVPQSCLRLVYMRSKRSHVHVNGDGRNE